MTVSSDKEQTAPKQINLAEPLIESVRIYLANNELPEKQFTTNPHPQPFPVTPDQVDICHVDIGPPSNLEDCKGINFEHRLRRNDLNNNGNHLERQNRPNGPTETMPSQAELMQRQPLLARNVKLEPPQQTTDESDPDQDHSSPQRTSEFIVEIPTSATREERYPKEVWKTVLSFFFLFGCVCVNMLSLSMVHERLPDKSTPPLNDIVLDNFTVREWGLDASEILIMISSTTAMLVVIFHKHRFIVSRRLFLIIGLLYLYRSVTMFVTVPPMASRTYPCSPKAHNITAILMVKRVFHLLSGFGLAINGKHTFCGDHIYSGHTMILVLSYLIVAEYSPKKLWPMQWAVWGTGVLGVCFLLLAHAHYTLDVVVAYYITTRLFWAFHSLLLTPHRHGNGNGYMIQREWWFSMFVYLERNVRGPVPRRYNWPLPWPRTKLFSRLS